MLFISRGGEFGGVRFVELDLVDDADDCGVHGAVLALRRHAGGASGNHKNFLAESGADGVYRD
jgi:hypothetical protein